MVVLFIVFIVCAFTSSVLNASNDCFLTARFSSHSISSLDIQSMTYALTHLLQITSSAAHFQALAYLERPHFQVLLVLRCCGLEDCSREVTETLFPTLRIYFHFRRIKYSTRDRNPHSEYFEDSACWVLVSSPEFDASTEGVGLPHMLVVCLLDEPALTSGEVWRYSASMLYARYPVSEERLLYWSCRSIPTVPAS